MTELTTEQINHLKEIVLRYLQGEALGVVSVLLETECAELKQSSKSLYKSVKLDDPEHDPFILAILSSLNIKGCHKKRLKKATNLHELLTYLYHDGHHHLGYLLKVIEHTKPRVNRAMMFIWGAIISAGIGSLMYFLCKEYVETLGQWFIHNFPAFLIAWLGKTFSVLGNVSLFAIGFSIIGLVWSWYDTFANGTTTTTEKLNGLLFKTLTYSLTILGYALSYIDSGVMSFFAASLFVLGASIDVFESGFGYYKSLRALETFTVPAEDAEWEDVAEYERAMNLHQQSVQSIWIKISAALLITVAIAIWSFFPPSLIISTCCITFITLLGLAKWSVVTNLEEIYANNLQKKLKQLETMIKSELTPAVQGTLAKIREQQKALMLKEELLLTREQTLKEREEMIAKRELIMSINAARNLKAPRIRTSSSPTARSSRMMHMHRVQANNDAVLDQHPPTKKRLVSGHKIRLNLITPV